MSRSAAPGSQRCCRNSANNTRTGGGTEDSGGDIFIAFATGNDALQPADYAHKGAFSSAVQMVNNDHLSELSGRGSHHQRAIGGYGHPR